MGTAPTKTAVAAKAGTSLTTFDYGEYAVTAGTTASAGFENTTGDDFSVPFLDILQGQSPEVESIPSAKPGMFHNTVTDDVYDGKQGVAVILVGTQHEYVEWKPRSAGGGIVAKHAPGSDVVLEARSNSDKFNELTHNGNDLVETFYAYLILLTPEGPMPAVLSNSSTRIKPYKAMMTKANMIMLPGPNGTKVKPPLFAHRFRLVTDKRKNNDGEWHTYVVSFDSPDKSAAGARLDPASDEFQAAVSFHEVIKAGMFKLAEGGEAKARETSDGGDAPF